jgi:hypothetical protein
MIPESLDLHFAVDQLAKFTTRIDPPFINQHPKDAGMPIFAGVKDQPRKTTSPILMTLLILLMHLFLNLFRTPGKSRSNRILGFRKTFGLGDFFLTDENQRNQALSKGDLSVSKNWRRKRK